MKTVYQTLCAIALLCTTVFVHAQVPVFNSNPSAPAVLFLDFDGQNVDGTSWNSNGPILCNGSNLTALQITDVYNRVAEDYRPFQINITTDSTKYWAAPATKRSRVILTTSSSWYGSAGGVAFAGSFSWGDNTPCFVFTALLGYNTKNIGEAASHEAGHTIGLRHQSSYDTSCNKTSEYNSGTGSGEIGWAPIMGVGYYRNLTLWNYGANPFGCSVYQDDLSIITDPNFGVPFRTDDYAGTTTGAYNALFTANQFTVSGIIEKPADADVVKFTTPANGRFQLDASPYNLGTGNSGSDLDLEVQLLNSAGATLRIYNPGTALNAVIDTQLTAGVYYLKVQGSGNVYAPNYASLGSYILKGTFTAGNPLPLHKLELTGTVEGSRHRLAWDIIADETIISQTLEVATDGAAFNPVANALPSFRTYSYSPAAKSVYYYRLNVLFDNGRSFYSNTMALKSNGGNPKPFLAGNQVSGSLVVSSPSPFGYTVFDQSGRAVLKGRLALGINNIATGFITDGLYIIQYQNAGDVYSEKFMKK